jgi:Na+-driven multidrug efflux pump
MAFTDRNAIFFCVFLLSIRNSIITVIILILGKNIMRIFIDTSELVDLSMHMMRILSLGYIAMAITQRLSGVMRGDGDTITPMWISLITTVVIRIPIAYGIAYFTRSTAYPTGRPESTFISLLVCWILGATITTIFFKRGKWKNKAITDIR